MIICNQVDGREVNIEIGAQRLYVFVKCFLNRFPRQIVIMGNSSDGMCRLFREIDFPFFVSGKFDTRFVDKKVGHDFRTVLREKRDSFMIVVVTAGSLNIPCQHIGIIAGIIGDNSALRAK